MFIRCVRLLLVSSVLLQLWACTALGVVGDIHECREDGECTITEDMDLTVAGYQADMQVINAIQADMAAKAARSDNAMPDAICPPGQHSICSMATNVCQCVEQ